jgi:hypothetical protein
MPENLTTLCKAHHQAHHLRDERSAYAPRSAEARSVIVRSARTGSDETS